jgi:hypothetical protein
MDAYSTGNLKVLMDIVEEHNLSFHFKLPILRVQNTPLEGNPLLVTLLRLPAV